MPRVALDVGVVDRGTRRDHTGIHQCVEQLEPEATARPAVEPVVDRREWPVIGRAVAPATADLQHMHDARDHPPVVYPSRAQLVLGQMRFDRCPRFIREPEQRYASFLLIQAPLDQEPIIPQDTDWV